MLETVADWVWTPLSERSANPSGSTSENVKLFWDCLCFLDMLCVDTAVEAMMADSAGWHRPKEAYVQFGVHLMIRLNLLIT
jgi:hypothetical protein